jgi:cyclic pyranopterin phosphate synthase
MIRMDFSHIDESGQVRMVDVSEKPAVRRKAVASGEVRMKHETIEHIAQGFLKKGDPLATARVAGIMAAKRTADLIPLCHPLPVDRVSVDFEMGDEGVRITAEAVTVARTGIEMEALTAVAVAALTIYDMCKAVDKEMAIGDIRLESKTKEQAE